ncbi:MAG: phytoene/squalene synthase family protein [Thermomonas sp.]
MDIDAAPAEFIAKWRQHWPEWSVAEAFVPEAQREVAAAWFALRHELTEAAWGGEDARPGQAKLEWWGEELRGWAQGRRRHPLGAVLQKQPVPWILLADSIPALLASRGVAPDPDQAAIRLEPFAEGIASIGVTLFADAAQPPPLPPPPRSVVYGLLAERLLRQGEDAVPDSIRAEAGSDPVRAWAARLLQRWAPPHHGSVPGRLQALLVRERLQACADGRSITSWSRLTLPWRCRVIARD